MSSDAEIERLLGGGSDPVADAIRAGRRAPAPAAATAGTGAAAGSGTAAGTGSTAGSGAAGTGSSGTTAELTPEQRALHRKTQTLTELERYRQERETAGASAEELAELTALKQRITENKPNSVEEADALLTRAGWDRSISMAGDAAQSVVDYGTRGLDTDSQRVVENTGIFATGIFNQAVQWGKGAWDYMRTEHPLLTRVAGGGLAAIMAMQFINPWLDSTVGKIPVIGGLLKMVAGLLAFAGITFGGMGLMAGFTQGNGSHTSTEAAAGAVTRTSHTGNLEDVPQEQAGMRAAQSQADATHTGGLRHDNDNDEVRPTILRNQGGSETEVIPHRGGDPRVIRIGGPAPAGPAPDAPVPLAA